MIFEHGNKEYTVSVLSGFQARLYESLCLDVLVIMASSFGVRTGSLEAMANQAPNTLLLTYKEFVEFCLSTKADKGVFTDFNITQLKTLPTVYNQWLDLCSQEDFYDKWYKAYRHENKEEVTEDSQKKEPITD